MTNYGLRKKPTYDSLVDYIQNKQPTLKYPDRVATQIMNSRELLSLEKIGMIGMEEQQQNIMKQQQRETIITQLSNREGATSKHLRTVKQPKKIPEPEIFDLSSGTDNFADTLDELLDEEVVKKATKKKI